MSNSISRPAPGWGGKRAGSGRKKTGRAPTVLVRVSAVTASQIGCLATMDGVTRGAAVAMAVARDLARPDRRSEKDEDA
jgi:hypothetical protein